MSWARQQPVLGLLYKKQVLLFTLFSIRIQQDDIIILYENDVAGLVTILAYVIVSIAKYKNLKELRYEAIKLY